MNRLSVILLVAALLAACKPASNETVLADYAKTNEQRAAALKHELGECRAQLAKHGSAESGVASVTAPSFAVWKTIQLGTDRPADPAAELKRLGFKMSDLAREFLVKTSFAVKPTSVDIVKVTVAELGFLRGATTKEIFDRADALGLDRLPAETGYWLRLAHAEQPLGEWICVGMDPIAVSGGLSVFAVARDDSGRWLGTLGTLYTDPTGQWAAENVWVFGRSKPRKE